VTDVRRVGAEVLQRGEMSSGHTCPRCDGGAKRERSLSVWPHKTLPGFVVAKCWRASCGYGEDVLVGAESAHAAAPVRRPPAPTPNMRLVTDAAAEFMRTRYRIGRGALDYWKVRQHVADSALYFPVLGPRREERGYVLRKFWPGAQPKAENIKQLPEQPFQGWLRQTSTARIVVVEDMLSAMRAWGLGFTAVALCGTNLSEEKLDEIKRTPRPQHTPILLALDIDALGKSLHLARRDHVPLQPVRLWRDIKDCSDEEIKACLN